MSGRKVGMYVGIRLVALPVDSIVPISIDRDTPDFVRAILGIYSLAENVAASMALIRHANQWTPNFRGDLSRGIRDFARRDDAIIRLFDILQLEGAPDLFVRFYHEWLIRDGAEAVMGKPMSFEDAFMVMQEFRNLQFATMLASVPINRNSRMPEHAQRYARASIRAAHLWVLNTHKSSPPSEAELDAILDPIGQIVRASCDSFLESKDGAT